MMRVLSGKFAAIGAIVAVAAMQLAGCAAPHYRHGDEAQRLGKGGLTVLVDSSVQVSVAGVPTAVSVPENAQIAVEMLSTAESALPAKGYALQGTSLLAVGAPFAPSETIRVMTTSGILDSPGAVGKPFIVRPQPGDGAVGAKVNELFLWAKKARGSAPAAARDLSTSAGLLLLACSGGNNSVLPAGSEGVSIRSFKPGNDPGADARSEVLLLLLDRSTGKPTWLSRGTVSVFTPEAVAKEVERLIAELPVVK